jgi:hypothetical protein
MEKSYRVWGHVPVLVDVRAKDESSAIDTALDSDEWELCEEETLNPGTRAFVYGVGEEIDGDFKERELGDALTQQLIAIVMKTTRQIEHLAKEHDWRKHELLSHLIANLEAERSDYDD